MVINDRYCSLSNNFSKQYANPHTHPKHKWGRSKQPGGDFAHTYKCTSMLVLLYAEWTLLSLLEAIRHHHLREMLKTFDPPTLLLVTETV